MKVVIVLLCVVLFSGCSTKVIVNIPFDRAVELVKNEYGVKNMPTSIVAETDASKPTLQKELTFKQIEALIKKITLSIEKKKLKPWAGYYPVKSFSESKSKISFILVNNRRQNMKLSPRVSYVTLSSLANGSTLINVYSENCTKPFLGCCLFMFVSMYSRDSDNEKNVVSAIVKTLNKAN